MHLGPPCTRPRDGARPTEPVTYTLAVKVVGLYLVRNEADIIETNLRHHFAAGIDEAIVIDNGSTDGTLEIVAGLREDLPIQLSSEVGPMLQPERVTRMARLATLEGADWVLPIDADEFWVGAGAPLREVLEEAPADARGSSSSWCSSCSAATSSSPRRPAWPP